MPIEGVLARHRTALLIGFSMAIAILSAALPAGCERSRPPAPTHTCLIVGIGEDDPLWPVIRAGAQTYAGTTRSLKLKMIAPAKSDPAAQADLARSGLDRTVTAVCLQSSGHELTAQLVKELTVGGTPVILIGQDIPDSGRFGQVGWDDFEAGKSLAEALKDSLGERTTFMLLYADRAGEMYTWRLNGFVVGMQDYAFLRELHRFDCQADPAEALRIIAEQGRRYPRLGAWACVGDWPARTPLEDLRRSLPESVSLAMIGGLPGVWPLLEQGLCPAAVVTDYGRWGYEAVSLSELAFHRAVKAGEIRLTPPRIVRARELSQFKRDWAAWSHGKITAGQVPGPPRAVSIPR
jgi:ABC-type sugar transport system substrate-binding protein